MRHLALCFVVLGFLSGIGVVHAQTPWTAQNYDLYAGDFTHAGKQGLLFIAKNPNMESGIAISDGTGPNVLWQSWPSNYLGISWSTGSYKAVVADFNGDGRSDIFLQATSPGATSYLILTDQQGHVSSVTQSIAATALGLAWTADQHTLIAGDFNGDGKADLFLQATSTTGQHAIVLADSNGQFTVGPAQTWSDGYLGLNWSTPRANVYAGNFDGDPYTDLLVQARPKIVLINYDVPFPIPTYPPNLNGVVFSVGGSSPFPSTDSRVLTWSRMAFGVDWSPLTANLIIGNFAGSSRSDVLLQAKNGSGTSFLVTANGASSVFASAPTTITSSPGLTADQYRVIAANFSGGAATGLYYQATSSSGSNYIATSVGASTTTVAASSYSPGNPTTQVSALPTAPGRTPTSFGVNATGAATYTIPLTTPPGIGDLKLDLALSYSSRQPDGVMGVGWNTTGLSAITRCNRTVAQDGYAQGITLSLSDRFCLNGQQLKLTGGTYGQPGSTYATELESFALVTASTAALVGQGPASFTVITKSGLVYQYGTTADSQILAGTSGTIRAWALSQITDRVGNAITLTYSNDTTNGSYRISQIQYPTVVTGVGPFYTVLFSYSPRPANDVPTGYIGGYLVREPNQLSTITTEAVSGEVIKNYNLAYTQSATTNRNTLTSVQECSASTCLAATTVAYQPGATGWSTTTGTTLGTYPSMGPWFGDFNGDGRTDIAYGLCISECPSSLYTGQYGTNSMIEIWVMLASGSGYGTPIDTTLQIPYNEIDPSNYYPFPMAGRVLGSGQDQLLIAQNNSWLALNFNGTGFSQTNTNVQVNGEFMLADIDGDGLADLVSWVSSSNSVMVRHNVTPPAGAAQFATSAQTVYTAASSWPALGSNPSPYPLIKSADFNGDGQADILLPVYAGSPIFNWVPLLSNGVAANGAVNPFTALASFEAAGGTATPQFLDWNGDGCTDITTGDALMVSNCASGFVTYTLPSGVGPVQYSTGKFQPVVPLDWDGDGRQDLMYFHPSDQTFHVLKSAGGDPSTATDVPTGLPFTAEDTKYYSIVQSGDGRPDIAVYSLLTPNSILTFYPHNASPAPADLATSFTDGFGMNQTVSYVPLTNASYYSEYSGDSYPEYDYTGPMYVVGQFSASDGTGGTYQNQFKYYGALFNSQGRGFEGFAQRSAYDSRNGVFTYDSWYQAFPYTGIMANTRQQTASASLNFWAGTNAVQISGGSGYEQRYFPYLSPTISQVFEVGAKSGQVVKQTTTSYTYGDGYGNPTEIDQSVTDEDEGAPASPFLGQTWQTTVATSYLNDTTSGNWCLGLPESVQVQSSVPGISGVMSSQTTQTRSDQYTPDPNHYLCRIKTHIEEPNNPLLTVTTALGHDSCGNVNSISVVGTNPDGTAMAARNTGLDYTHSSGRCQFPEAVTNAQNETTYRTYNYNFGVEATSTDPNQLQTVWSQDDYGRTTWETRPDGTYDTWGYQACNTTNNFCGVTDLRMQVLRKSFGSDNSFVGYLYRYVDGFSRERYREYTRVLGTVTIESVLYDSLGRPTTEYLPYSVASNGYKTFAYDILNRATSENLYQPNGSLDRSTSKNYLGQTVNSTNPRGYTTILVTDVEGRLRQVIDPSPGGTTQYGYGAFGDVVQLIDSTGASSGTSYSVRGFALQVVDSDRGTWNFSGDSLRELVGWTDAKGQSFGQSYDALGRRLTRSEPEGLSSWVWGQTSDNTGTGRYADRLKSVSGYGYSEVMTYDQLARPWTRTITTDQSYQYGYTYNSIGKLSTLTYPTSPIPTGGVGANYTIQYGYSYGSPSSITDVTNANSPAVIWSLNAANDYSSPVSEVTGAGAYGTTVTSAYKPWTDELTAISAGFGGATGNVQNLAYQWDVDGNLSQRQDNIQGLTEAFTPDPLDRLLSSTLNGQANFSITYDAAGDILTRSDDGTVANTFSYTYGNAAHPHAVMSTTGGLSYTYDANGNAITKNGLSYSWASYNLPTTLQANVGGTALTSTFSYGPEHDRYEQAATYSNGTEITYYVGDDLEKMVSASGVSYWRHYVTAPSGRTLVVSRNSDGSSSTEYVLTDHLGSSDAIVDGSTGAVSVRESFNPFGVRRGSNWTGSPSATDASAIAGITRHGFTSHEHLDNIGLIHMGGRVYDPASGRFLSVDPIVGEVGNTQAHNPYSYVSNRPLVSTDPSGLDGEDKPISQIVDEAGDGNGKTVELKEQIPQLGEPPGSKGTPADSTSSTPLSAWTPSDGQFNNLNTAQQSTGSMPAAGSNAPTSEVVLSADRNSQSYVPQTPTPLMTRASTHWMDFRSRVIVPDPNGTEIDVVARHSIQVNDDDFLYDLGNSLGMQFFICGFDGGCSGSQWAHAGAIYASGVIPVSPEIKILKSGIKILDRVGPHVRGVFEAAKGEGHFVTELVREGETLILRGTHIEGQATLRESLEAARAFGREQGAKKVIIEGGKRTTGARPGHIPKPIVLDTGL
jgi:RHS repeat-associated protein